MVVPHYVQRFQCSGGQCPDTCCAGWNVYLDQPTYALYLSVEQEPLRSRIRQCVAVANAADPVRYGKISFAAEGATCGMYTADGLCAIQAGLGEGALSNVCDAFPRVTYQFGDRVEQSLSFSCPEAIRLALASADAMAGCEADLSVRSEAVLAVVPVAGFDLASMDRVRRVALNLLETSSVPLLERLLALGLMCARADELARAAAQAQIDSVLEEILAQIEVGALARFLAAVPVQPGLGANVFTMLLGDLAGRGFSGRHGEMMAKVTAGLGLRKGTAADPEEVEVRYRQGLARLSAAESERVLAVFLMNEVLRDVFPWGHGTPLMKSFRRLLLAFGTLRLMLAAVALAESDDMSVEKMACVVQVHARLFMHDAAFFERGERLLLGSDMEHLERLCALLG